MSVEVRLLGQGDEAALDAFLAPHTPFAYFMRSNPRRGGLVYQGRDYQADYFAAFVDGKLSAVMAHSWIGSVQVFIPNHDHIKAMVDLWRVHLTKNPRPIPCVLGPSGMTNIVLQEMKIRPDEFARPDDEQEGLFVLDLAQLGNSEEYLTSSERVRVVEPLDIDLLTQWRYEYFLEVFSDPEGEETKKRARVENERRLVEKDLFVLEDVEGLKSYCGASGFLPDWKIVGPVWTPPEYRNRGYAQKVMVGGLHYIKQHGATHVALFAVSPPAIRAYENIGFRRIGEWRLALIKQGRTTI